MQCRSTRLHWSRCKNRNMWTLKNISTASSWTPRGKPQWLPRTGCLTSDEKRLYWFHFILPPLKALGGIKKTSVSLKKVWLNKKKLKPEAPAAAATFGLVQRLSWTCVPATGGNVDQSHGLPSPRRSVSSEHISPWTKLESTQHTHLVIPSPANKYTDICNNHACSTPFLSRGKNDGNRDLIKNPRARPCLMNEWLWRNDEGTWYQLKWLS